MTKANSNRKIGVNCKTCGKLLLKSQTELDGWKGKCQNCHREEVKRQNGSLRHKGTKPLSVKATVLTVLAKRGTATLGELTSAVGYDRKERLKVTLDALIADGEVRARFDPVLKYVYSLTERTAERRA